MPAPPCSFVPGGGAGARTPLLVLAKTGCRCRQLLLVRATRGCRCRHPLGSRQEWVPAPPCWFAPGRVPVPAPPYWFAPRGGAGAGTPLLVCARRGCRHRHPPAGLRQKGVPVPAPPCWFAPRRGCRCRHPLLFLVQILKVLALELLFCVGSWNLALCHTIFT